MFLKHLSFAVLTDFFYGPAILQQHETIIIRSKAFLILQVVHVYSTKNHPD